MEYEMRWRQKNTQENWPTFKLFVFHSLWKSLCGKNIGTLLVKNGS